MYEVYLERRAERDLKRLPEEQFQRVASQLKALADNPRPVGSRKLSGSKSYWRVRVGDYRIVYEIDDEVRAVRVMRVRHRGKVYRP
ncbi:MAG: type II toxin-antitoxin system RelE/ParE family toxin [Chloroflexota bacterium]